MIYLRMRSNFVAIECERTTHIRTRAHLLLPETMEFVSGIRYSFLHLAPSTSFFIFTVIIITLALNIYTSNRNVFKIYIIVHTIYPVEIRSEKQQSERLQLQHTKDDAQTKLILRCYHPSYNTYHLCCFDMSDNFDVLAYKLLYKWNENGLASFFD